jgi:hypothetical protein
MIAVILAVVATTFFMGCDWNIFLNKNAIEIKQDSTGEDIFFLPQPLYDYKKISQDEVSSLGFIILPFHEAISCYKKSDLLFVTDTLYAYPQKNILHSLQTLKDLYSEAGWALEEECHTNQYYNLFFTQADKDCIIFIQQTIDEKIFIHQSIIVHK